jgi:hypothetical protein
MTSIFEEDSLPVPPEIANHSTYAPDELSGYYNHSLSNYSDANCKECHGKFLSNWSNTTSLEFVHNVGRGECWGCHYDFAYMNNTRNRPGKFVNETLFNNSVHGDPTEINCWDCHTYAHPPPESGWKWCESCHVANQSTSDPNRHNLTSDPQNNVFNSTDSVMDITDCTECHDADLYDTATATYNSTSGKDCRYCHTFPDYDPESPY